MSCNCQLCVEVAGRLLKRLKQLTVLWVVNYKCSRSFYSAFGVEAFTGFVRVLENLESLVYYCDIFQDCKDLEISGKLLNLSNKMNCMAAKWISIEILGVKGLVWILESRKNQSHCSPGKVLEKSWKFAVFQKRVWSLHHAENFITEPTS